MWKSDKIDVTLNGTDYTNAGLTIHFWHWHHSGNNNIIVKFYFISEVLFRDLELFKRVYYRWFMWNCEIWYMQHFASLYFQKCWFPDASKMRIFNYSAAIRCCSYCWTILILPARNQEVYPVYCLQPGLSLLWGKVINLINN